ncbi:MAG: CpsD/CapB family tyrosine-protein kinase [Planctomycetota bacterium]
MSGAEARGAEPSPAAGQSGLPETAERPGGLLSRISHQVVMYHDARSLHAEQYRACRTNLAALNRGGGPWSVVVTSSRKGEGKSVTAANVAACLGELSGARVCLIDADFRSPRQAGLFGLPNQPGLTELHDDKATLKQVLLPTVLSALHVLPAGSEPRSTAELLGSERFANLIDELKRRYTWVLIDTPPVNPYTDACVLAARCNGALLVVRMEQTTRDLVARSIHNLQRAGGRVLGSFLTGLTPDRDDSDRYGYYRQNLDDEDLARQEVQRAKARRAAQRRLLAQEKAWLKERAQSDTSPKREPEV